jgi:SAM-dependent methyltransferase
MNFKEISQSTVAHYDDNALSFKEGTWEHDVSQNRSALIAALQEFISDKKHYDILDFGCGPGRDLVAFSQLGHKPIGLDGSPQFCQMAEAASGREVWCQDFLDLKLPDSSFDGIFANASLFHIPSAELERVLKQFFQSLRPRGVLFSSIPRGHGEGFNGARWAHYMEIEQLSAYIRAAGFELLSYYYRPTGKPRNEQPWLASLCLRN